MRKFQIIEVKLSDGRMRRFVGECLWTDDELERGDTIAESIRVHGCTADRDFSLSFINLKDGERLL